MCLAASLNKAAVAVEIDGWVVHYELPCALSMFSEGSHFFLLDFYRTGRILGVIGLQVSGGLKGLNVVPR